MPERSLEQWLEALLSAHPWSIDMGIDRIKKTYTYMLPIQPRTRVITVSGTNGKGSCIAALEAMAMHNQLSCAAYTSPHVDRFEERLRVDGAPVATQAWCEALECVERARARANVSLTFFEHTTLAALDLARQRAPQLLLLEVGLGGLLDAVNIVDSDVAILTSVAMDHEEYLGNTLETIAEQKAGIFRAGRAAIVAEPTPPQAVARVAKRRGAQLYLWGQDFQMHLKQNAYEWRGTRADGSKVHLEHLSAPVLHAGSVAASIQAWQLLFNPDEQDLSATAHRAHRAHLTGRWQQMFSPRSNHFILDVAHNPAAARYLCERLKHCAGFVKINAVWAMRENKDMRGFVEALKEAVHVWYPLHVEGEGIANVQTLDAAVHAAGARLCDARQMGSRSVEKVLDRIDQRSQPHDVTLICGSFAVVAASLRWFESHRPQQSVQLTREAPSVSASQ